MTEKKIRPLPTPPVWDEKTFAMVAKINELIAAHNGDLYADVDGAVFAERCIEVHRQREGKPKTFLQRILGL